MPLKKPKSKKKKTQTTAGDYDTFFLAFAGEHLEIVAMLSSEVTEGTIKTNGFLLDYNDEYYFLGETPHEITHCVKREKVTLIQVMEPGSVYQEILEEMEIPKDERGKN